MEVLEKIKAFITHLTEIFSPEKVILFGSHAAGTATEDSDVDILVIMPFKGKPAQMALEILNRLNPKFPIDLIVRTPEQIEDRLAKGDFFIKEIMEKGKVLYEAADAGMGAKGGRGLRKRTA